MNIKTTKNECIIINDKIIVENTATVLELLELVQEYNSLGDVGMAWTPEAIDRKWKFKNFLNSHFDNMAIGARVSYMSDFVEKVSKSLCVFCEKTP